MLHIKNNSVVCSLVLGASYSQLNTLQNFLYNNHVEAFFFDSAVRLTVFGVKTYKIPQKCLKSFDLLVLWVIDKVNKELSNFK